MKSADETTVQRRRGAGLRDTYDQTYSAPMSAEATELYRVTVGDGPFPTTGQNTVFMVQLLAAIAPQDTEGSIDPSLIDASGQKFPAINLGSAVPVQDETLVRCDSHDGQLFFCFNGNGSAS